MDQELLATARGQADQSDPPVRATAWLRIARVLGRTDPTAAERLVEKGLALARQLDAETGTTLLDVAVFLAATVSPSQALSLYPTPRMVDRFGTGVVGLMIAMADHGHVKAAIAYLEDPVPGDRFPLSYVGNLARQCRDDETRLRLLRAAILAWKQGPIYDGMVPKRIAELSFTTVFSRLWHLLPKEEAAPILRELMETAQTQDGEPSQVTLTANPDDPVLDSREYRLFRLMPALQSIEPERAQALCAQHSQLAAAIRRFPRGMDSVYEAQLPQDALENSIMIGDFIGFGGDAPNYRLIPIREALANHFQGAFDDAGQRYTRDTDPQDPNQAPKEYWSSAQAFRNILFKAGEHQGIAASQHLDRIPDPDLRLFAQIELCAAIAGLPQFGGMTQHVSSRPAPSPPPTPEELARFFGPLMPGIECPQCHWQPRTGNRWHCDCDHQWNTFDTRGVCPSCQKQWSATRCLACRKMSPHSDWYVRQ